MSQRRVIDDYERDITFMFNSLKELTGIYRTIIASASDCNGIALATKKDVREALKTARKVEAMIDRLISTADHVMYGWEKYANLKTDYLEDKIECASIQNEIDESVRIQG